MVGLDQQGDRLRELRDRTVITERVTKDGELLTDGEPRVVAPVDNGVVTGSGVAARV